MNEEYYAAIDKMEKANVSREYIVVGPAVFCKIQNVEEQRVNDAYEAGYTDGEAKNDGNFDEWVGK